MSVVTGGAPPQGIGIQRYQLESGLERMTPLERAARAAVPRNSRAVFDPARVAGMVKPSGSHQELARTRKVPRVRSVRRNPYPQVRIHRVSDGALLARRRLTSLRGNGEEIRSGQRGLSFCPGTVP